MGLKTYTCSVCGKEFQPKRKDQKYCSSSCREQVGKLRRLKYYQEHREKFLEYHRKYYQDHKHNNVTSEKKVCQFCGREFQSKRINQIYCSKSCRERAFYWRHHEERLEEARENYQKRKEHYRKFYQEHKEEFRQKNRDYWARKKKIDNFGLDLDEFKETGKGADCPFDFDCLNCPEQDCIAK